MSKTQDPKYKSSIRSEVEELVDLIVSNQESIDERELEAGRSILHIFVSEAPSKVLVSIQIEAILEIIDDLADGAPRLKTKVMGLEMIGNTPKYFEYDEVNYVKTNVIVSGRMASQPHLDQWRSGHLDASLTKDEINSAVMLCIHHIAMLRK